MSSATNFFSLVIVFVLLPLSIKAQTVVSPTVSGVNFGKFADLQPNLYNGSLALPIPLGELSKGSISTSVGLAYHTAGIRTAELASEVGLGWSLQAGGAITRQVKGLDDLGVNGWLFTGNQMQFTGPTYPTGLLSDIRSGNVDPEADLFTYSADGITGKFFFNTDGSIQPLPNSDIRIEHFKGFSMGVIYDYFEVTEPNGTTYYFGDLPDEDRNIETINVGNNFPISAWHLTKKESFDEHHSILYEYIENDYQFYSIGDCSQRFEYDECKMSLTKVKVFGKLLSKIETETGVINFDYKDRFDLPINDDSSNTPPQRIDKIRFIKDGRVRKVELIQGHFLDNESPTNGIFPLELDGKVDNEDKDALKKRLRLLSLVISGEGSGASSTSQQYFFSYYGKNASSGGSFFRNSTTLAYDHWGYPNHKLENNIDINNMPYTCETVVGNTYCNGFSSVSRAPDFNNAVAGSLEKITFPTGGFTKIEYELNKYGNSNTPCGGLRVKKITTSDNDSSNPNPDIVRDYTYGIGTLYKVPKYSGIDNNTPYFSSRGYGLLRGFDGLHVSYPLVEIDYNGNGSQKIYYYTDSAPPTNNCYPPLIEEYSSKAGATQITELYREDGQKLSSSETVLDEGLINESNDQMMKVEFFELSSGWTSASKLYNVKQSLFRPELIYTDNEGILSSKYFLYGLFSTHTIPELIIDYDSQGAELSYKYIQNTSQYWGNNYADVQPYFANKNILIPFRTQSHLNNFSNHHYESDIHFGNFSNDLDNFYPESIEVVHRGSDPGSSETRITQFNSYQDGLVTSLTTHGAEVNDTYEYDNVTATLKKECTGNLCKDYDYHGITDLLKSIIDVDGTVIDYDYDNQHRLSSRTNCTGASTTYQYNFSPSSRFVETKSTFPADVNGLSALTELTSRKYIDGLGRALQTVGIGQAFSGNDQVVSAVDYDDQGRVVKKYETFESSGSSGAFVSIPGTIKNAELIYEPSPLNRILQSLPPEWDNKGTTYSYGTNTNSITGGDGVNYSAGSLFSKSTEDPNGNKNHTYKDIRGRLILNRRTNNNESLTQDTKYIYDNKNRLTEVIPPESSLGHAELNYFYNYDPLDNILSKKIPSKAWVTYSYDDRDLLRTYQDGYLNYVGSSIFYGYRYDILGREIKSGIYVGIPTNNNTDPLITYSETIYGTSGSEKGKVTDTKSKHLDVANPGSSFFFETENIYDACGRLRVTNSNNITTGTNKSDVSFIKYDGASNVVQTNSVTTDGTGMVTNAISFQHLDNDGRNLDSWLILDNVAQQLSATTYTEKDEVQTEYVGGSASDYLQKVDYEYLDNGILHKVNGGSLTGTGENDLFAYQLNYFQDIGGFNPGTNQYNGNIKSSIWHSIDEKVQVQSYTYDFLDRLKISNTDLKNTINSQFPIFTSADAQKASYTYDKRGNFQTITRNRMDSLLPVLMDDLTYNYDSANPNRLVNITESSDKERGYKAPNTISDYTYDYNGNLTYDPQKGITTTYNILDLAEKIVWDDGRRMEMDYEIGGSLIERRTYSSDNVLLDKRQYLGGIEYVNDLRYAVMHGQGRVVNQSVDKYLKYLYLDHEQRKDGLFEAELIESTGHIMEDSTSYIAKNCVELLPSFETKFGSSFLADIEDPVGYSEDWRWEWDVRDHLGNIRMSYADEDGNGTIDPATEIIQRQDYYPYGLRHSNWEKGSLINPYQFNGIDHVNDFGLDWNMATFRNLDPAIGIWTGVDPKAELGFSMSPYCSMGGNPISNVDPDGDWYYAIPSVSFGSGGLSVGLEVGVGVPVLYSMSVGGSYNVSHNQFNGYVKASLAGMYMGYGTQGGFAGFGIHFGAFNLGGSVTTSSGASISAGVGGAAGSGNSGFGVSYGESGFGWGASASAIIDNSQPAPINPGGGHGTSSVDDFIYLLDKEGVANSGVGHSAMLIQGKDGKWYFRSKRGTNTKGVANVDEGGPYNSPQEFYNSPEGLRYESRIRIEASLPKSQEVLNAVNIVGKTKYNIISNNCEHMCKAGFRAAGISYSKSRIPMSSWKYVNSYVNPAPSSYRLTVTNR